MTNIKATIHDLPARLLTGVWVEIGHLSSIRLVTKSCGPRLEHSFEGRVKTHNLEWLVDERPLLNLALKKNCDFFLDVNCKPA